MPTKVFLASVLAAATLSPPALAVNIVDLSFSGTFPDLSFSGTVLLNNGPYGGQTFSGNVVYDIDQPRIPRIVTGNWSAEYPSPFSFTYTIGGVAYNPSVIQSSSVFDDKRFYASVDSNTGATLTAYAYGHFGFGQLKPSDLIQTSSYDPVPILVFYAGNLNGVSSGTVSSYTFTPTTVAVPEIASWVMMVGGFGMIGSSLRKRKQALAAAKLRPRRA